MRGEPFVADLSSSAVGPSGPASKGEGVVGGSGASGTSGGGGLALPPGLKLCVFFLVLDVFKNPCVSQTGLYPRVVFDGR